MYSMSPRNIVESYASFVALIIFQIKLPKTISRENPYLVNLIPLSLPLKRSEGDDKSLNNYVILLVNEKELLYSETPKID